MLDNRAYPGLAPHPIAAPTITSFRTASSNSLLATDKGTAEGNLNCDRMFPCKACVKRGCAEICPDGSLTTGKGSRFILANTEQLHDKIDRLTDRITQLESALESLQSQISAEPHPLLTPALLLVKSPIDLYGDHVQSNFQNNSLDMTSTSISDPFPPLNLDTTDLEGSDEQSHGLSGQQRERPSWPISDDISRFSACFPETWTAYSIPSESIQKQIYSMLPIRLEAERVCAQVQHNAFWQYSPDDSETFLSISLAHVYDSDQSTISGSRLSTMFMVLAIGSLVDLERDIDPAAAESYHQLARAALCQNPLADEASSDCLVALLFMIWYLLISYRKPGSIDFAWSIMELATEVAQNIGLDQDEIGGTISPEDAWTRGTLCREFLDLEARLSLSLGKFQRSLFYRSVCRNPDVEVPITNRYELYHGWKSQFVIQCVFPVLKMSSTSTSYESVIRLDRFIRMFPIPDMLQLSCPTTGPAAIAMQKGLVSVNRATLLMQLHQTYLLRSLNTPRRNSQAQPYWVSLLATYHDASEAIQCLDIVYTLQPNLSTRYLLFWLNALSAAAMLCLLTSRGSLLPLSTKALGSIEICTRIFRDAQDRCSIAKEKLTALDDLASRLRLISGRSSQNKSQGGYRLSSAEDGDSCVVGSDGSLFSESHIPATIPPDADAVSDSRIHPALTALYKELQLSYSRTSDDVVSNAPVLFPLTPTPQAAGALVSPGEHASSHEQGTEAMQLSQFGQTRLSDTDMDFDDALELPLVNWPQYGQEGLSHPGGISGSVWMNMS
ncbi:hypothetical protein EVG20_g3306 [Dentipellis fragilis]|uniref:Transcription factor domain-containing protein n=1 Tax=Dentipellis fragilis TaxID=205917 RepID=A0A4Y9Z2K4_9AGAM|nr:hypothetical protein EVG20_g3306 [Dentipellis fragilis]